MNVIGCCIIPSRAITVLESFLLNSSSCAFPSPASVNVTKIPALAYSDLVANWKVSGVIAIGYTFSGSLSVEIPR